MNYCWRKNFEPKAFYTGSGTMSEPYITIISVGSTITIYMLCQMLNLFGLFINVRYLCNVAALVLVLAINSDSIQSNRHPNILYLHLTLPFIPDNLKFVFYHFIVFHLWMHVIIDLILVLIYRFSVCNSDDKIVGNLSLFYNVYVTITDCECISSFYTSDIYYYCTILENISNCEWNCDELLTTLGVHVLLQLTIFQKFFSFANFFLISKL